MKPLGSQQLFAMRLSETPPLIDHVWVDYGHGKQLDWARSGIGPTLRVRPEDPVSRLDLRCCVGLDVIYEPLAWDDKAAALYEKLQEYAKTIIVVSLCFAPEMGWSWDRKFGRLEIDDLQWIDKLDDALGDCVHWAHKNNKAKYEEAKAREMKIYAEHPWIRGH